MARSESELIIRMNNNSKWFYFSNKTCALENVTSRKGNYISSQRVALMQCFDSSLQFQVSLWARSKHAWDSIKTATCRVPIGDQKWRFQRLADGVSKVSWQLSCVTSQEGFQSKTCLYGSPCLEQWRITGTRNWNRFMKPLKATVVNNAQKRKKKKKNNNNQC